MQKDFHYYMTYIAARAAGYRRQLSHCIGEYDEIVDEAFNSIDKNPFKSSKNQWVKEKWNPTHIAEGYCHRTAYSTMAPWHAIKKEARNPDKAMPWMAFHFLPGLGPDGKYKFDYNAHERVLEASKKTGWIGSRKIGLTKAKLEERFKRFKRLRKAGGLLKWDYKQQLICWRDSPCSNAMMDDVLRIAKTYKSYRQGADNLSGLDAVKRCFASSDFLTDRGEFDNLFTRFDHEIRRLGDMGGLRFEKFLAALLGVRMHTFNDTWAHQGFAGIRSAGINDVTDLKCAYQRNGKHEDLPWKSQVSQVEKVIPEICYYGHVRADCFPDHPGIRISYKRPWDDKIIERENPGEFKRAYKEMVSWFKKIGAETGWSRGRQSPPGFSIKTMNEDFFRKMRKVGGKKGTDEKKYRCDFLNNYIEQHDGFRFAPYAKVDGDFGIIRQMYTRSKVDLAYFSLASFYHQRWFEKQLMTRLDKINAKNANELIRKIIGPANDFAKEVISY